MAKRVSTQQLRLQEILPALKKHLPELRQTFAVKSLGVFGSYVRGENKPGSDLDLLVEFDRAPTMFQFVRLESHLASLLGIKVDLVMKSALKPGIGEYILDEVVPV